LQVKIAVIQLSCCEFYVARALSYALQQKQAINPSFPGGSMQLQWQKKVMQATEVEMLPSLQLEMLSSL
jgi:hypothetical protein